MQLIFSAVGVGIAALGGFSAKKSINLTKRGIKTQAKIIDVKKKKGSDEDGYTKWTYQPILEFKTKEGQTQTFPSDMSDSNPNKYKIGNQMEIIYDPQNPQVAGVNSFVSMWLVPGFLILAGIGILVGSFFAET